MAYNSTSCALSDNEVSISDSTKSTCSIPHSVDSEINFGERLKICCKPKYQPRKLRNKGAILVLVLNFLVTNAVHYIEYKSQKQESYCPICFQLITVPIGIALMFSGWLADVYFERFNVIRWSIIITWISSLLLATTFMIEKIVTFTNYYELVFLVSLGIGYGMFQANIIQFGIDQLTDASTEEIQSFINWYVWSSFSSASIISFVFQCTSKQYSFIAPLMLCVSLSVVTSVLFLCNKVFIKEPVTQNPFKLIFRVLKYAIKHDYAKQRSAFTYCEDDIPSRLDFGKSKYGGPFTTEQVEDVKTFFGVLSQVLIVSSIFAIIDETYIHTLILNGTTVYISYAKSNSLSKCFSRFVVTDVYHISVALLIPFNEIFIHPIFRRCTPNSLGSRKIVIGFILQVVRYVLMVTFFTLSRQHYHSAKMKELTYNETLTCIFSKGISNDSDLSIPTTLYDFGFYSLTILPDIISSISFTIILIGAIEFLCAQIPYSMKGVIIGLFYCSLVVLAVVNEGITKTFIATSSAWSAGQPISCGFWYLLTKIIVLLVTTLTSFISAVIYKKRRREDVLPNEHFFAERYYSKKLQCK